MVSRLIKHIEQLLRLHSCIVVPGLGGFMLELRPAYIDKATSLIYPPANELHFNELLQHQDGLLAQAYADAYAVSHRRARLILEEDVSMLRRSLVHRRRVAFGALGTLTLSESGRIIFEPQAILPFQGVAYGLMPLPLPHDGVSKSAQSVSNGDYLNLRISKRALSWGVAVSVFVLALLPWGQKEEGDPMYRASVAPTEIKLDKVLGAVTEAIASEEVVALEDSRWITPKPGHYYVIIGTEHREDRALHHYDEAQKWLPKSELNSLGILKDSKVYRVSAAEFADASQAYVCMQRINRVGKQAWIYKAK